MRVVHWQQHTLSLGSMQWQNSYTGVGLAWWLPVISGAGVWDPRMGGFTQTLHPQARDIDSVALDGFESLRSWMLHLTELSSPIGIRYPGGKGMSPPPSGGIITGELWEL